MPVRNSSEFLLALDSIQARSQVFSWGATMQKGDGPNETWRGKSLGGGGGSFSCLRLKCKASLQLGGGGRGFDLECVDVCHLGLSGGMLPRNIFNFKPSEMAANAFKTNMGW